jgi:hypothetical protein
MAVSTTLVYILSTLLSLALSYGIYKKGDLEAREISSKINKNKVSYSDVLSLINKIKNKASGLSLNKRNKLASDLTRTYNSAYQSSGLSEQLLGDLRTELNKVSEEIDRLRTLGDVESTMSENLVNSYASLSDSEKAKSKKDSNPDTRNAFMQALDIKMHDGIHDPYANEDRGPKVWDPETAGGRTMLEAEEHANKAKEYYDEANALGEKYAK